MLKNEPCFIGTELDEVSLPMLTKNSQNGDLLDVKRYLLGDFLAPQAWRHRSKKNLNCVPPDDKMREALQRQKKTRLYKWSKIRIRDGRKQGCLLSEDWLGLEMTI